MKYICVLNDKEYEVEVRRVDDFTPLTRAAAVPPAKEDASEAPAPAPAS